MASVATSNITDITARISGSKGNALNLGVQPVAVFRITAGQAAGDTAVLTSAQVPVIQSVWGPVTHSITATSGVTSVTVTLAAVTGSAVTVTVGTIDVYLVGPVPTS